MNLEDLYSLAMSLFEEGHSDEAILTLEKCANDGFAEAQFQLANLISENKVSRSLTDMVMLFSKAAEQNHLYSINNLAICYQQGYGTDQDLEKAFELLNKAYLLGDAMAGFNVGQAYWFGLGVAKDMNKGLEYVLNAAHNNCPNAQFMLGQIYENGIIDKGLIIDADINKAIYWYKKAADLGDESASDALERLIMNDSEEKYPLISFLQTGEVLVRADVVSPDNYDETDPKYMPADAAVAILFSQVQNDNNPQALDLLVELSYNYMNKLAFNALNSLGKIADMTDDNTRQGFAQFMFDAWKSFDRKKLETLAFWSYPSFEYVEYDSNNHLRLRITDEKQFVDHLMNEMKTVKSNGQTIRMRLSQSGNEYMTDVMVGNTISTFKFIFGDKTFLGIERHFQDLKEILHSS